MSVDVVIPLYNGSKWIQETIDSVFRQSLKPNSIIVVDDGSTDGSQDIVAKIPEVIMLRNPGKGTGSARNFGFEHTTASFIAFLDQDDIWHPDHLKILSGLLEHNPDISVAASQLKSFFDGTDHQFDFSDTSVELLDPWSTYPTRGMATTPSLSLFRRQAIADSGGWPVMHDVMSDYSIWLRLSVKKPLIRIQAKTVAYRRHQTQTTVNVRTQDPMAYLEFSLKVDDDLMEYYLSCSNNETKKAIVKRRNLVAHYTYDLVHALLNRNKTFLVRITSALEKNLDSENEEYRKCVFKHICNILSLGFTPGSNSREFRDYLITLVEEWPKQTYFTRNALYDVIFEERPGFIFYFKYWFKNFWRIGRLNLFFRAMIKRMHQILTRK